MAAYREWSPPQQFDEYRLVQPLGHGGMGHVFLAYDTLLDRMVAVKFISAIEPNSEARERFLIEARAAARLQHPNVAAVYRVGELDRRPYIISEFIRGTTLDKLELPVPWKRALELGVFLARGLAAAHRHGVLHRDIKPSNAILAEDGGVKLVDFGLAKLTDDFAPSSGGGAPSVPSRVQKPRPSPSHTTLTSASASGESRGDLETRRYIAPDEIMNVDHTLQSAREEDEPELIEIRPENVNQTLQSVVDPSAPKQPKTSVPDIAIVGDSLTRVGDVMGTPYYMAPEVWRGEPGSRRSDVYALGVVLYELCAGFPPHREVRVKDLRRVRSESPAPPLADVAPQVDPRFATVVDRCLERDPSERYGSADELLEALEQLVPSAGDAEIPEGNPYRGLHSFEAEHRALFFGRGSEIRALIERLRSEPFVLVAGDSGTGKSSLCRAGVLPLVEDGAIQEGRTWSVLRLVPGRRPIAGLAAALSPILHNREEEKLIEQITSEPDQVCRDLRKRLVAKLGLVIFIDQLEELLTLSSWEDATTAAAFFGRLAAGLHGVRLLATVRGDFLTRLARLPGFANDLTRALYLLRPMSPDHIREAIVGPAHATGVRFESEKLVETLVTSTARTEGALPLLQFALAELWEARDKAKQIITQSALSAVGGVEGALARHADGVLAGLLPNQRTAARRILMRLVTAEGARTRRTEEELVVGDAAASAALEALVRGRLLAAREVEGATAYEIAHEALLHGWTTLREWLDAQAESRAVRQRLEAAAAEWDRLGRAREALWSARQLGEATSVRVDELKPVEAEFLRASRRAVRTARFVRNAMIIAVPLLVGLLYAGIQFQAKRELDRRIAQHVVRGNALLEQARSKNREGEGRRKAALARFDALDQSGGEAEWAGARALVAETERAYARASQEFESALVLDSSRPETRSSFANILYERALLAELDHRVAQRDELLERLALYDEQGERLARFNAPAKISVTTKPVHAKVLVERYVSDQGRIRTEKVQALDAAPSGSLTLPPGSYVLTLTAPERFEVRYPVTLARAEDLAVTLDLPRAADIPAGFIYVPPGRFMFGSATDDRVRAFLSTVPIHQVKTDAYLIARNETTYADWIDYLSAIPVEKRLAYRSKFTGIRGSVELAQLPNSQWQLTIQPTVEAYTAKTGQLIEYKGRTRRVTQDWLRFPVSYLSIPDVEGYLDWLRFSGRVPGARLCTEYEWERAARGADAREYPHGDRLQPDDANYDRTYGLDTLAFGPDEVGSHETSRSPFGLDDMTGNVFEWTRSVLVPNGVLARGGSFYFDETSNRSTNRIVIEPTVRDINAGLRVCTSWESR
jgi:serine/threonine protein kinase/formylglycine-generating enzyme required for sulfatase activity